MKTAFFKINLLFFFLLKVYGSEVYKIYLIQVHATAWIHAKTPTVYPPMLLYN